MKMDNFTAVGSETLVVNQQRITTSENRLIHEIPMSCTPQTVYLKY